MRRHIHYEAAFEDCLRARGLPYIPVDEARKVLFAGWSVKSFDFLVYQPAGPHWLTDVKGRKFPYDTAGNRRLWENWVKSPELADLTEWQDLFGNGFEAMLVFAYLLTGRQDTWPFQNVHCFRGQYYAFCAISVRDYRQRCVRRSESWDTVSLPSRAFRDLIRVF